MIVLGIVIDNVFVVVVVIIIFIIIIIIIIISLALLKISSCFSILEKRYAVFCIFQIKVIILSVIKLHLSVIQSTANLYQAK